MEQIGVSGSQPVRPGHYAAINYMANPGFREIRRLFERLIGDVHFRPTNKGLVPLDLHPASFKPLIGVGNPIRPNTPLEQLRLQMPGRLAHLERNRALQDKPARERILEASLIRSAQANGLRLPGFPGRLRFVHSQWRIDRYDGINSKVGDLTAIDLPSLSLVLIELKRERSVNAWEQVRISLAYFQRNATTLCDFFMRVAHVMGDLYACPELARLQFLRPAQVALTAWPDAEGSLQVEGLEQLDSQPFRNLL